MKKIKNYNCSILIPRNVEIKKNTFFLILKGPLGLNFINLSKLDKKGLAFISICNKKNSIFFCSQSKDFFTCFYNIIKNKINGITRGFLIYLKIYGVGYRITIEKQLLIFKIGFSHDVQYVLPKSIRVFLIEPTLLCLYGLDKNQITQAASKIKQIKKSSVYKGKGIRILNEPVILKLGKRK